MARNQPPAAAIYARISRDPEGQERGVTRQIEDCRAMAARQGFDVVDVYTDNDIGASTRSRKRRPEYDRMIADAESGRVGVVLAYSNSRLTRRPLELEHLLALHDRYGTRIVTVVSGEDDLSTADGRMVARIKASVDAAEAERTAERVRRSHLANARAGVPVGGTRPFGWADDKRSPHPVEAPLVAQAAADVLAGVSTARIAEQWNAAGLTTTRGHTWDARRVTQVLRSPRLAGWRVHQPTGTAWTPVPQIALDRNGEQVRGQWTPLLDDATWRAVVARLGSGPERRARVPRRNARHYLLTGLLRCAKCNGGRMYANRVGDSHYYRCDAPGCSNAVSGKGVDAMVARAVVEASELIEGQAVRSDDPAAAKAAALRQQIAEHEELIDDVMQGYRERKIKAQTAFRTVGSLEETRDRLLAEVEDMEAAALAAQATAPSLDTAAWQAMDTDRQRATLEARLAGVWVRPAERRGNRFDDTRVDLDWR